MLGSFLSQVPTNTAKLSTFSSNFQQITQQRRITTQVNLHNQSSIMENIVSWQRPLNVENHGGILNSWFRPARCVNATMHVKQGVL